LRKEALVAASFNLRKETQAKACGYRIITEELKPAVTKLKDAFWEELAFRTTLISFGSPRTRKNTPIVTATAK